MWFRILLIDQHTIAPREGEGWLLVWIGLVIIFITKILAIDKLDKLMDEWINGPYRKLGLYDIILDISLKS